MAVGHSACAALNAHMERWRLGDGFNANPIDELREQVRWLCERIDSTGDGMGIAKKRAQKATGS